MGPTQSSERSACTSIWARRDPFLCPEHCDKAKAPAHGKVARGAESKVNVRLLPADFTCCAAPVRSLLLFLFVAANEHK